MLDPLEELQLTSELYPHTYVSMNNPAYCPIFKVFRGHFFNKSQRSL